MQLSEAQLLVSRRVRVMDRGESRLQQLDAELEEAQRKVSELTGQLAAARQEVVGVAARVAQEFEDKLAVERSKAAGVCWCLSARPQVHVLGCLDVYCIRLITYGNSVSLDHGSYHSSPVPGHLAGPCVHC